MKIGQKVPPHGGNGKHPGRLLLSKFLLLVALENKLVGVRL